MSKLIWDKTGERIYETGVSHVVLYPYSNNSYQTGVAWNGCSAINESSSGAEATPIFADNIKYLNILSSEEFSPTIEAYTYPDEFAACDGSAEIATGVISRQQSRKPFGLSYQSKKGNDVEGEDYGYIIHLVYGALAAPSERSRASVNESPEAVTFSWAVSTTPVEVPIAGFKPSAHFEIDSTKCDENKLTAFENIIYGTENTDPRLPLPSELVTIFGNSNANPNPNPNHNEEPAG